MLVHEIKITKLGFAIIRIYIRLKDNPTMLQYSYLIKNPRNEGTAGGGSFAGG